MADPQNVETAQDAAKIPGVTPVTAGTNPADVGERHFGGAAGGGINVPTNVGDPQQAATPGTLTPPAPGAAPDQPQLHPEELKAQAHESALGKLVKSMYGVNYEVTPELDEQGNPTGKMTKTPIKEKPGSIFRHMVMGAMLGMAAGAEHPEQGLAGGVARGAAAGVKMRTAEQDKLEEKGKEEFEQKQKAIKLKADIAHSTHQDLIALNQLDFMKQTHIEAQNQLHEGERINAELAGGTKPTLMFGGKNINGQEGNAHAFMDNMKEIMGKVPEGMVRKNFMTVNMAGLTQKVDATGVYYVDKDNKRVDPALERTTHTVVDVPIDGMERRQEYANDDLIKWGLSGFTPGKKTYLTPHEVQNGIKIAKEIKAAADNAESRGILAEAAKLRADATIERANSAKEKNDIPGVRVEAQSLDARIKDLNATVRDITASKEDKAEAKKEAERLKERVTRLYDWIDEQTGVTAAGGAAVPAATAPKTPAAAHDPMTEAHVSVGGQDGFVPFDKLSDFLAQNPGAVSADKRLRDMSPDEALFQLPGGGTQVKRFANIDKYMKEHPEAKLIGRGIRVSTGLPEKPSTVGGGAK